MRTTKRTQKQILSDMLRTIDQLRYMVDIPEDVQELIRQMEDDMYNRES